MTFDSKEIGYVQVNSKSFLSEMLISTRFVPKCPPLRNIIKEEPLTASKENYISKQEKSNNLKFSFRC